MSSFRLVLLSLVHHRRIHAAVALGVMAATAVLTGALLVGDSVRGSLRDLTLDRLGRIDHALLADQFFRAELADELAASEAVQSHFTAAVPVLLLQGTVENPAAERPLRASKVTVVGGDGRFWQLHDAGPRPKLLPGTIVLNQPLADELRASPGDELLLRIAAPSDIPADSPLGKKSEISRSRRLQVAAVIPAQGLGRFSLQPSQQISKNAFVSTATLQEMLEQDGMVNAVLIAGRSASEAESEEAGEALAAALRPRPIDYGLKIERVRTGPQNSPLSDYYNITSEAMLLSPRLVERATQGLAEAGVQPALTYLANTITSGGKKIPYSTVTGIDSNAPLGPLSPYLSEPLADDEIVLNDWAADDLGAEPGDEIGLTWYEPESTHGALVENEPRKFRLRAIVPLADSDGRPTRAADRHLTPELRGVTDQASIDDWDLPFELVERIRKQDEDYWDKHRATPKAFVTLAAARSLWTSRFGDTTSLRVPRSITVPVVQQPDGDGTQEHNRDGYATIFARLDLNPIEHGFQLMPAKRMGLAASEGTTGFQNLFLGFSVFIIAAAVMLVALLFRLGVQQRANEVGIELATGLPERQIRRLLAVEGLAVAAVGALAGLVGGIGYAWLMLAGLRTWWLAAVSTPLLHLHVTPLSLVLGYFVGIGVSLATISWVLWRMKQLSVRQLLAGQTGDQVLLAGRPSRMVDGLAWSLLAVAVLLGVLALRLSGEAQAGAFFGSGGLVLAGVLTLIWTRLRAGARARQSSASFGLLGLAVRNGARNPARSTLTIGLIAAASFVIIAISALRLETMEQGAGGFALVAESDQPIVFDIDSETGRADLAFNRQESDALALCRTYSLRVRAGEDASCLNLYQSRQPRVLGLPRRMIERGGFAWAASAARTEVEQDNPWLLLDKPLASGAVPVVIDAATAIYSLHLRGVGDRYEIDDDQGGRLKLEVVGLLKNSIFQGDLLISEEQFLRQFPQITGYRFFLVETPGESELREALAAPIASLTERLEALTEGDPADDALRQRLQSELAHLEQLAAGRAAFTQYVSQSLEETLGDHGFNSGDALERLAGFLAVQNTYLSTFQSLGGLGLLLGTLGLAAVQLRSMMERRGELALMRAAGFRRRLLARLVMLENSLLLLGGLAVGVLSALVAVLPHFLLGGAAVPWQSLLAMLTLVVAVGLVAGALAARAVLKAPLLAALRGQ